MDNSTDLEAASQKQQKVRAWGWIYFFCCWDEVETCGKTRVFTFSLFF